MALITIITDASHCPNTLAGGYGVWVTGDHGRKSFRGPLSGAKDSSEIESKAMCNGLWHGIRSGLIKRGDVVLMQTDCDAALKLLQGKRPPRYDAEFDVLDWFTDTTISNGILVRFRHVKGHTQKQDQRSKSQRRCDRDAGIEMNNERKRLSGAITEQVCQLVQPVPVVQTKTQQPETDWVKLKQKLHSLVENAPLKFRR